jgi:hypothetical protein
MHHDIDYLAAPLADEKTDAPKLRRGGGSGFFSVAFCVFIITLQSSREPPPAVYYTVCFTSAQRQLVGRGTVQLACNIIACFPEELRGFLHDNMPYQARLAKYVFSWLPAIISSRPKSHLSFVALESWHVGDLTLDKSRRAQAKPDNNSYGQF